MEHSLHVAAKHFVETVGPTSSIRKNGGADNEFSSESDDIDNLNAGDSLGKALALVKQVSSHSKHCLQDTADES